MVSPSGGCFPGTSRVRTEDGRLLPLSQVAFGDRVLSFEDSTGSLRYDDVISFLHRSEAGTGNATFVQISVAGGASITLTGNHLIYSSNTASADDIRPRFAGKVVRGDYVFYAYSSAVMVREVVNVDVIRVDEGLYAPLTSTGNIVIDDVISSCYAEVTSHRLAHLAMAPIRLAHSFAWYLGLERTVSSLEGLQSDFGIHPYAALLRTVADYFLPEVFDSEF